MSIETKVHGCMSLTTLLGCCCSNWYSQIAHHLDVGPLAKLKSIAAALNVTEPTSTGIGGDMFCLFYNAETKKISAMNGSGRYAKQATLEDVRRDLGLSPEDPGAIPLTSALAATTPGAAAGWVDTIEKFGSGKLSLQQILAPAIELAEEGFPVSELSSYFVRIAIKARFISTSMN